MARAVYSYILLLTTIFYSLYPSVLTSSFTKDKLTLSPKNIWQTVSEYSSPMPQPILSQTFGQTGAKAGTQYVPFNISGTVGGVDQGQSIVIDSQGRIVIGGLTNDGTNFRFAIARFLSNGQPDISFGQTGAKAGTQYIPFSIEGTGTDDAAYSIAVDSQDRIILGGYTNNGAGVYRFAVARFLTNGQLDSSFGQINTPKAGTQYITFSISGGGNLDVAQSIILDTQGRILIGGYSGDLGTGIYRFAVARFLSNGQLDTTFGQTGTSQAGTQYINFSISATGHDDTPYAITLDSQQRIILGGYTYNGTSYYFALACFLSNGQLDTTFGQVGTNRAGTQYIPFSIAGTGGDDVARGITVDTINRILLSGSSTEGVDPRFAVTRFLPNGQLDITFGQTGTNRAGTQYIPFSVAGTGGDDIVRGMALDSLNRILLSGSSIEGAAPRFAIARFLPDGQLDTNFGQNPAKAGTYFIPFGIQATVNNDQLYGMVLDSRGNIFLSGFNDNGAITYRFTLAKLTINNSLVSYQAQYPTQGGFY